MKQSVVSIKKRWLRNGKYAKHPPHQKKCSVFISPAFFHTMLRVLQVIRYAALAAYAVFRLFRD